MGSDPIIAPTAHDLFDAGLWTIDDDLRIRVAQSDIAESILPGGSHFKLADLHGRRLSFAPKASLRLFPEGAKDYKYSENITYRVKLGMIRRVNRPVI